MYVYFLFYWCLWMIYLIVYFFMKTSLKQSIILIWLLLIIISKDLIITVQYLQISVGFIIIILGAIIYFVETKVTAKRLVHTFLLMIGYGGFMMWHQIAPVWFFLPAYLMLPILMLLLVQLLERNVQKALPLLLLSIVFGQCVYQGILMMFYLTNHIGDIYLLLQICLLILFVSWIHLFQKLLDGISTIVHRKLV